jgi:DNA-directed RNA polymerase specialized sigma24 family protein
MSDDIDAETHEDDDAWEGLYRTHYASMVRLAGLLIGDYQVGEEVAQDAFARLFEAGSRVREPAGYLRATVVNLCRSRIQRLALERPHRSTGSSVPAGQDETDRAVERAAMADAPQTTVPTSTRSSHVSSLRRAQRCRGGSVPGKSPRGRSTGICTERCRHRPQGWKYSDATTDALRPLARSIAEPLMFSASSKVLWTSTKCVVTPTRARGVAAERLCLREGKATNFESHHLRTKGPGAARLAIAVRRSPSMMLRQRIAGR